MKTTLIGFGLAVLPAPARVSSKTNRGAAATTERTSEVRAPEGIRTPTLLACPLESINILRHNVIRHPAAVTGR